MGNCKSVDNVSSAQKLNKSSRPLFAEVGNDTELNNMYRKLQEDLKKLTSMNQEQQQCQQDLNKELGINQNNADIHKTAKTILTAIQVFNHCELKYSEEVNMTEKFPYFSKKLRKANKDKEVKQLITSYKKLIKSIQQNHEVVQQILEQIINIEKYLNGLDPAITKEEKQSQNAAQLKSSREKVLLYYNQMILPLVQDHTYVVSNFSAICEQSSEKSHSSIEEKKFNIHQIANSIFLPNTQVSI